MTTLQNQLHSLRAVLAAMRCGKAVMPYHWMFDVENARTVLLRIYQSRAQALGRSTSLYADIPELSPLREAILRLSSLSFLGGFGVTFTIVINTVREAVRNMEEYLQTEQNAV